MINMKQLNQDISSKIQSIANSKDVAVIGFVAPQNAVRLSPSTFATASIDESEMYELEKTVKKIKSMDNSPSTLHLIIQTPGGELFTAYKIAHYLRSAFDSIKAFVPYQAASGGTLICCAANEIYFGNLGNLTPVDPQVRYGGTRVSAYAFERCVESMKKLYGEKMPSEVPTPWQQMSERIDPIVLDEMATVVYNTYMYVKRLLKKSGYSETLAMKIAYNLSRPDTSHSHPILRDDAKEIGLNVKDDEELMSIYGEYVSARLKENEPRHIIDYFVKSHESETASTSEESSSVQEQL